MANEDGPPDEGVSQDLIIALAKLERHSHLFTLVLFTALGAGASWVLWAQPIFIGIRAIAFLGFVALVGFAGTFASMAGLARAARFGRCAQAPGVRLERVEGGILFELPDGLTRVWFVAERAIELARLHGLPRARIRDRK